MDLFPRSIEPFSNAWTNDHFYLMIPIEHVFLNSNHYFGATNDLDKNSIDVDKANFLMLIKDLWQFLGSITSLILPPIGKLK